MVTQRASMIVQQQGRTAEFVAALLAAIAAAVAGRMPRKTKVRYWLQSCVFRVALDCAYSQFADRYPHWVTCLFDEHFLKHSAAPLLRHYRQYAGPPSPTELAKAWDKQLGPASAAVRERRIAELTPAAADFLECLMAELRY